MQYKSSEGRMNLRDKINQQVQYELAKNMIPNAGFGRQSIVKSKKKSVVVQKEKLYEDNYDLRNRIKELQQMNLKLKTQLLVAEKEKDEIFNIAEDEVFNQKLPQRSQSSVHKIIATNVNESKNNILLLKEKQNYSTYKKLVREKQNEIEKLTMQNANIKRTMKFTRMNEFLTQNNELIDETKRLKIQILELKNYSQQTAAEYVSKIENLKRQLQHERGGEKRNTMQLKRQMEMVNQLKQKLRQTQLKKIDTKKRINRQMKALKIGDGNEAGSKNLQENYGKECDKLDCLQTRSDKVQLKKKVEQLQKENMRLNHELLDEKKKLIQQMFQYKRLESAHKKAQAEDKIKSAVQHRHVKPKSPKIQQKHSQRQKSPIKNDSKLSQSPKTKKKEKQKKGQVSEYLQELINTDEQHYSSIKAQDLNESIQAEPEKNKSYIQVEKKQELIYKQSDGQYQQIQIQEQKSPKPKGKQEKIDKNQKQNDKKQSGEKRQKTRNDKSIQKSIISQKVDIDPQHTQQHVRKDQENQRAELKLIKKTLTYKFMAQGYTYDQISVLVQQSQKKEFTVTEIMNVFTQEPFLLSEQDIQTMIIYLFESDNLSGEEAISTKHFLRKMNKFIGKVKPLSQQHQKQRTKKLIQIVKADENGKKKIRTFSKNHEFGEGLINKDRFVAAMKEVKVKDELLQTALAQIVYISKDFNHLSYQLFLKRLTETAR